MTVTLGIPIICAEYVAWLNDPEVTYYLEGNFGGWDIEKLHAYVTRVKEDSFFKGIYVDDVYVGNIKAGPISLRHQHADIGIMIGDKSYWGKGVATQAINLMADECFDKDLHCLTAGIIQGNIPSVKAFEKAGFQQVGIFHAFRMLDGVWKNELFFERLDPL